MDLTAKAKSPESPIPTSPTPLEVPFLCRLSIGLLSPGTACQQFSAKGGFCNRGLRHLCHRRSTAGARESSDGLGARTSRPLFFRFQPEPFHCRPQLR